MHSLGEIKITNKAAEVIIDIEGIIGIPEWWQFDNPDERGDWIYIHDTIKAMLLVWNAEKPAQRFYTVCGSVHTLREVAELTNRLCPETKVTYAGHSANTSPYACSFDDSAIRKELGYAPDWSIEDSVKDYIRVVMGRD